MYSIKTTYSFDPDISIRGHYETKPGAWNTMFADALKELALTDGARPTTLVVDPVNFEISLIEIMRGLDETDTTEWEVIEIEEED